MTKTVKIDVSPYVAKLLTIEASYKDVSRVELANKILLEAISQKTKDYVGLKGNKNRHQNRLYDESLAEKPARIAKLEILQARALQESSINIMKLTIKDL
jgi:hypothetical protein